MTFRISFIIRTIAVKKYKSYLMNLKLYYDFLPYFWSFIEELHFDIMTVNFNMLYEHSIIINAKKLDMNFTILKFHFNLSYPFHYFL